MDEPLGGYTIRGTPVAFRTKECFPAESRDLFWEMDKVASGINGALEPLNFDSDGDGLISDPSAMPSVVATPGFCGARATRRFGDGLLRMVSDFPTA